MSPPGNPVYRFDDIEIDASRGCVTRAGREQHLRQQTFKVLLYLLDQRQRVVTKQELLKDIWHDTAVTDNALVQCIADIRKVLGDDRHQPRFIRTVSRVGYRFIGEIDESRPREAENSLAASVTGLTPSSSTVVRPRSPRFQFVRRPVVVLIALAIVAVSAVGTVVLMRSGILRSGRQRADITLPQIPGRKALAVMFFENQSAKAELDWLREGLADMLITDLA